MRRGHPNGMAVRPVPIVRTARRRLGGVEGNELLTISTAAVLTLLLLAEGVTILRIGGLRNEHMFIGMALIPPVVLKLASVGYRFVSYYAGAAAYREKGPPALPLRVLAPALVAATLAVFVTGVALLLIGHKSGTVLLLHKVSFIVWGVFFGVHFLAYLPRLVRTLPRARRTAGGGLRTALLAASAGGGVALALTVLPLITGWRA
jgi:hypothetical protein